MTTPGAAFTSLLAESYAKLVGEPLIPEGMSGDEAAAWLYYAPFGLLAQNMSDDPIFVYANRTAQEHFGYTWDELVGLPSRLSAGGRARKMRCLFMKSVRRQGYAVNYRGLRIAKSGRRFWIEHTTVWNLLGAESELVGQAALIRSGADD